METFDFKNSSEQERGIFPSLPDTSTFGVNSPQMARSEQPANGTNKSQKTKKKVAKERQNGGPIHLKK